MAKKKTKKAPAKEPVYEFSSEGKRLLKRQEEFEIMKLVLDKFLWLGVLVIGYGLFRFYEGIADEVVRNVTILVTGAILLVLFVVLLKKEYDVVDG